MSVLLTKITKLQLMLSSGLEKGGKQANRNRIDAIDVWACKGTGSRKHVVMTPTFMLQCNCKLF